MKRVLGAIVAILFISACASPIAQYSPQALPTQASVPMQAQPTLVSPPAVSTALTPEPTEIAIPVPLATETISPAPSLTPTLRPTMPGEAKIEKSGWGWGNSPDFQWFWSAEEAPGGVHDRFHQWKAEASQTPADH